MRSEILDSLSALMPADFFHVEFPIPSDKLFRLPDYSPLLAEECFADVYFKWNDEGIYLEARVKQRFEEACFPAVSRGDALELLIDTRDLKSAGFLTRFCHQFVILPEAVQGIKAQEITRFRTEDAHPLCDGEKIQVSAHLSRSRYTLEVGIPRDCLHGYDPSSFDRLGFTYRLHRHGGKPQHFSVSSASYAIEHHSSLWASFLLQRRKK